MNEFDLSECLYDLNQVPAGKLVVDVYSDILDFKEFSTQYDDDVMRWLILTVDDGSPFYKQHRDFSERGMAVYKHLNISKNYLAKYIENRPDLSPKDQSRINLDAKIFKYFVLLNKVNYTAWYTLWQNYNELNAFLRLPLDPKDDDYETKWQKKENISSKLADKQTQLASYEKQLYGDSRIKAIAVKEVAKLTNWPEKMAIRLPNR